MAKLQDLASYFDYPVETVLRANAERLRILREEREDGRDLIDEALRLIEEAIVQVEQRS